METSNSIQQPEVSSDPELARILDEMLAANETITARAAARKHPSVHHASAITRHPIRSELLRHYQARQKEFRIWSERLPKFSRAKAAASLAQKDQCIADLKRQNEVLQASHIAAIRSVGELGGMKKWLEFFESWHPAIEELRRTSALPEKSITEPIALKNRKGGTR